MMKDAVTDIEHSCCICLSKILKHARRQNEKPKFVLHVGWNAHIYYKAQSGQFPLRTIYMMDIASNTTIPIRKPFGANCLVESDAVGKGAEFVKEGGIRDGRDPVILEVAQYTVTWSCWIQDLVLSNCAIPR